MKMELINSILQSKSFEVDYEVSHSPLLQIDEMMKYLLCTSIIKKKNKKLLLKTIDY